MFIIFSVLTLIFSKVASDSNIQDSTDSIWKSIEKSYNYSRDNVIDSPFSDEGNKVLIDGDIVQDLYEEKILKAPTEDLRPRFIWHQRLWKRIIPYKIRPELRHATSKFLEVFKRIEKVSCLRFRPKYPSDEQWMEYYVGSGCMSGVGRRYYAKGRSTISIGKYCDTVSTILHETMHSLGFWHEQNRDDRDSFVTIYENRITKFGSDQFWKGLVGMQDYFGTPYDYHSIMQYFNKAFIKPNVAGNVIEAKFDPNMKLGGTYLSNTDIIELNKLYQCHIKSGWSDWTEWSQCLPNTRKICTRASVRFCTSINWKECPGADRYGVQNNVIRCPESACASGLPVNGQWGKWGAYSLCDSKCGWGVQTRYRKCDNPTPRNGGNKCKGSNREKYFCRRSRCGRPNGADNDFESGFRGWEFEGFKFQTGRAAYNSGPAHDHTSIVDGRQNGRYALATEYNGNVFRTTTAKLISPTIYSYSGKKCFMFYYQLNGAKIYHDRALAIYVKEIGGRYINFAFSKGGHQGNYWKRAAVDIENIRKPFKIGIIAKFQFGRADIAIDDIFFDHSPCLKGLEGCKDILSTSVCLKLAKEGKCKPDSQYKTDMVRQCCKTCSDPNLENWKPTCKDHYKDCDLWFRQGECESKSKWMKEKCCLSCKKKRICDKDRYISSSKNANCKLWAEIGECIRNPKYMLANCCKSCEGTKCIDEYESCPGWGIKGFCTTGEKKLWFRRKCCKTCLAISQPQLCKGTTNAEKDCEKWAKQGECRKNSWMADNCCPACKKFA